MGAGCRKVNVTHALAPHLGLGDFDATFFANDTAVLETLVLAAEALVVFDRAKDLGTKQTIALRLEGAVVDGLRLFNFAKRPGTDLLGRSHADLDGIEMLVGGELLEQVE